MAAMADGMQQMGEAWTPKVAKRIHEDSNTKNNGPNEVKNDSLNLTTWGIYFVLLRLKLLIFKKLCNISLKKKM